MTPEHFDVIVVGGGLSGVDAAHHLQAYCPGKSYAILEARDAIGGTWDLFRYPGIRSDSDMYTFGYSFRPWESNAAIADGESIRSYIRETAQAHGIDRKIRFRHRVKSSSWSSADARWTLEVERAGEPLSLTCDFLVGCTGYYDYAGGYMPEFPGVASFRGRLVHPQAWPQDLDYTGKRVVVIGSGATAVTIIPVIAETAARVTMLQRSPTYIVSRPSRDALATWLRRRLPTRVAFAIARWYNVLFGLYFYNLARRKPEAVKRWIISQAQSQLGDGYDVKRHFSPRYNPWDQRLCLAPDADFFRAIKDGKADVVTDQIETFTASGIRLQSGKELEADIVVAATGLNLQLLGGIKVAVDGKPVKFSETMNYKGVMFSDVPNFAAVFGYTNASWTLKADLTCAYLARLIGYMDKHGYVACTPRQRDPTVEAEPFVNFSSSYFQRAIDQFPRQGSKQPWKLYQNYMRDLLTLRYGPINDRALEFVPRPERARSVALVGMLLGARHPHRRRAIGALMSFESDQGAHRHAELADLLGAAEIGEIDDEAGGQNVGADLLEQLAGRLGGAAGRDQIINQDDAFALEHRVLMHLHLVDAVFQRVADAHALERKFPFFADRHEAGRNLMGDRAAEDEAARLDARHLVDLAAGPGLHQFVDRTAERARIAQQRGDVAKHDPRLGIVRDVADRSLEITL
jgi:cation diffusion facilitator CzcD-associated flavoprotein CzcO